MLDVLSRRPARRTPIDTEAARLAAAHRHHHRGADLKLLREAYRVAAAMHQGQTRDSGEPYIVHPVAVARILADLGLDTATIAAALLHDTVEDTSYTLIDLRNQFGDTIAGLVDGVTKLDRIYYGEIAEAETFRKMILAARDDIRVPIIKIADRLHNMRTLRHKPGPSQTRTATVTRDILIPLADRLGIYTLRRELEDRVLAILNPDAYQQIDAYLRDGRPDRDKLTAAAATRLAAALRRSRIRARVEDRPRHHYSIYREMAKHPHLGPQDPPRLAVVVAGGQADCYAALGVIHGTWPPVPGRFKDRIAAPKYNLYQSLHTTVLGPDSQPMDALIRTSRMHQVAQVGIIADLTSPGADGQPSRQLDWLDRLVNWQQAATEPGLFLESLRTDLTSQEITIITSDGTTCTLPAGATSIDLAYHLDPAAADRLVGAVVNGQLTALAVPLHDGDQVELIHGRHDEHLGPSASWLSSAQTPYARLQIAQAFATEQPAALTDDISHGRTKIEAALHRSGRALPKPDILAGVAAAYGYPDEQALFLAIHNGQHEVDDVVTELLNRVDHPSATAFDHPG